MIHIENSCENPDCIYKNVEQPNLSSARRHARTHVEHTGHDVRIDVRSYEIITEDNS